MHPCYIDPTDVGRVSPSGVTRHEEAAAAGAHAHKLKSSARSVGALALGELCAQMEQAGKSGDAEALAKLLPRFEQELAGVEGFLEGVSK